MDALNQLKALHKAGVMSNNQSNQFDRLVKAVEQMKSRPIWTPNTTRQQQADLVEHLKKELSKVLIRICCCFRYCCRFLEEEQMLVTWVTVSKRNCWYTICMTHYASANRCNISRPVHGCYVSNILVRSRQ